MASGTARQNWISTLAEPFRPRQAGAPHIVAKMSQVAAGALGVGADASVSSRCLR